MNLVISHAIIYLTKTIKNIFLTYPLNIKGFLLTVIPLRTLY